MKIVTVQYMRRYPFKIGTHTDLLSALLSPSVNINIFRLIERLKCHVFCKGIGGEGQEIRDNVI